jgi:predicted PurR-regulated permease PerM
MERKLFNKYLAISIVIILCAVFLYHLVPYLNAFFGAMILFFLFYPLYKLFTTKLKIGRAFSAILVIIITLIIIIVPLIFIVDSAGNEISYITTHQDEILSKIHVIDAKYPSFHIVETINKNLPSITTFGGNLLINQINSIIKIIIILFIMYCVLYYLFIRHELIEKSIKKLLPFNKINSDRLVSNFKKVTMSILISTGLIAIIQGVLLALVFFIFGIKGAIVWGIIGAVVSFLPFIGLAIIYIPFSIIYLLNQNYYVGIGVLILGGLISLSEYLIRPAMQKKMGDIHPLISIIGLFVGISAFGFIGIIMGPLLITYILLTYRMFMEEYIKK